MQIIGFIEKGKGQTTEISINVDKLIVKTGAIIVMVVSGLDGGTVYANPSITEHLQPLVDLLKDLAEPISYGFMIKGFMKIMAGEEHEGIKTIKGAIGGFIGIQWIPYIFKIIKSISF